LDQDHKGPHECAARLSGGVEEDLCYRHAGGGVDGCVQVAEADAEGYGQQPAQEPGGDHGRVDGDRPEDGGVVSFFGHAGVG